MRMAIVPRPNFAAKFCQLLASSLGLQTGIEPMIKERLIFLVAIFLLCTPSCIRAQGTYTQNGIRNGYGGGPGGAASSPALNKQPAGSPSKIPSGNPKSIGTGQNPYEGAFSLTPQLQKETGIC